MKRPYKVLSLPSWAKPRKDPMFERSFLTNVEHFKAMAPVFNRDGHYYDRFTKCAWIERDGKAWVASASSFEWDLKYNDGEPRLESRVYDAIKVLMEEGLADKQLRVLYCQESHARSRWHRRLEVLKLMRRMASNGA